MLLEGLKFVVFVICNSIVVQVWLHIPCKSFLLHQVIYIYMCILFKFLSAHSRIIVYVTQLFVGFLLEGNPFQPFSACALFRPIHLAQANSLAKLIKNF